MAARRDRALGQASKNCEKLTNLQISTQLITDYGMAQGEARRARGGSWHRGP
ncbi:hypothetical protein GF406_00580 [candidate division KSB1 bacterium]|nr:hypothetical protein [candidate division KSB1 bacterium]